MIHLRGKLGRRKYLCSIEYDGQLATFHTEHQHEGLSRSCSIWALNVSSSRLQSAFYTMYIYYSKIFKGVFKEHTSDRIMSTLPSTYGNGPLTIDPPLVVSPPNSCDHM